MEKRWIIQYMALVELLVMPHSYIKINYRLKQKFKCKNKTIKILRKMGINYSYQLRVGRPF